MLTRFRVRAGRLSSVPVSPLSRLALPAGDLSCVAPQSFEGVVFANILLKNVDDDVTKVHDDPLGRRRLRC